MSTAKALSGDGPDDPTVPKDGFDAVNDRLDLDGVPQATARSRIALAKCHDYLAKFGAASERDLRRFYRPQTHAQPESGRYADRGEWWSAVGRPQLLALPGVEESDDGLLFTGVSPGEVDETCRASELEVSDDVKAEHVIITADFRRQGAWVDRQRDALISTWNYLQSLGEMTESDVKAELDSHGNIGSIDQFWRETGRDVLADMPGIEVTREGGTPDPESIEVETLADVIDGLRDVGAADLDVTVREGTEVWRGEE